MRELTKWGAACSAGAIAALALSTPSHRTDAQQAWPAAEVHKPAPRKDAPSADKSATPKATAEKTTAGKTTAEKATADKSGADKAAAAAPPIPTQTVATPPPPHPEPPTSKGTGTWPRLVASPQGATVPATWSEIEIAAAQKSCIDLLRGLDIVAVGAPPLREGSECGAAAPIELISVGTAPQVTFSPTVVVTCDMAAALHKWVTKDLQPLARKHLGSPLVRIETMSSYSCRGAYGRARNRLSEHGKANAIDIRGFLTTKSEATEVLANWGPIERDVQAQIAAAKAAAEKQKALAEQQKPDTGKALATGSNPAAGGGGAPAVAEGPVGPRPSVVIGAPGAPMPFPSTGRDTSIGLSGGLSGGHVAPSRLGGPKPAQPAARGSAEAIPPPPKGADGRMLFLREAHVAACRVFGTVLGPEADNAHRNHFHVDMAVRARSSFCQ